MKRAFASDADFSGMLTTRIGAAQRTIGAVLQQAAIEVDQQGTEAAAATAIVEYGFMAPETIDVRADRPFLYLLRDRATETVLLIGRVANPS